METRIQDKQLVRKETRKLILSVASVKYNYAYKDFESNIRVDEVEEELGGKTALDVISLCNDNGIYAQKNHAEVVSVGYLPLDFCKKTKWFEVEDHSIGSYGDWFTASLLEKAGAYQVNFSFEEYVKMGRPSQLEEEIIHSYNLGGN